MREIPLAPGASALVDDEDYERLAGYRWYLGNRGYAVRYDYSRRAKGSPVLMHRELLSFPAGCVDHANRNKLDNRRENLRLCTMSQNLANAPARTTHAKGVVYVARVNRWRAGIMVGGKRHHLGYFASESEAASAYDAAAIKHFGAFARTNAAGKPVKAAASA